MYLFDSDGRPVELDPTDRPYVTLDPSGRWELGADGSHDDTTIYATSDDPGICRATNAMVFRVRFALIEALSR